MRAILLAFILISPDRIFAQQKTVVFKTGINNVWVIPAGVSSVSIEAWGGGGGGGNFAGGQGGGYFKVSFTVRSGSQISCVIGKSGTGGNATGGDGGNTDVDYVEQGSSKSIRFVAAGGRGGSSITSSANGDYYYTSSTSGWLLNWRGYIGQNGSATHHTALAVKDADYVLWAETGGHGGEAGGSKNTNGWGGSATSLMKQNKPLLTYSSVSTLGSIPAVQGTQPGGGGGAMPNLNPSNTVKAIGAAGGPGLVIITY